MKARSVGVAAGAKRQEDMDPERNLPKGRNLKIVVIRITTLRKLERCLVRLRIVMIADISVKKKNLQGGEVIQDLGHVKDDVKVKAMIEKSHDPEVEIIDQKAGTENVRPGLVLDRNQKERAGPEVKAKIEGKELKNLDDTAEAAV